MFGMQERGLIEMQEIGDFKYPNRKPIILLILAILIGLMAFRWHKAGPQVKADGDETGGKGRWSCSVFHRKQNSEKNVEKPAETQKPVVPASLPQPTNQQVVAASAAPLVVDTNNVDYHEALTLEQNGGSLALARSKYIEALKKTADAAIRSDIESRLSRIGCQLVMTPSLMPEKQEYVVQGGDSLDRIAKKFGTTIDLLEKGNMLSRPDMIRAGDRLHVLTGKFSIEVSKSRNELVLLLNKEFFKKYSVGTGKFGKTPVGAFVVDVKMKEPPWSRPDGKQIPFGNPENILGTRWMSIKAAAGSGTPDFKGYGIHGTWDESSIGKAESAGCIRMRNAEVEELYTFITPGTVVTIVD